MVAEVKHSHYKKDVSHLDVLDVYRIQELWTMHPCAEHVVKKMLVAGGRGHKDLDKDIQDCIDTLQRWQEMRKEDGQVIDATCDDGEPVGRLVRASLPGFVGWKDIPEPWMFTAVDSCGDRWIYTGKPTYTDGRWISSGLARKLYSGQPVRVRDAMNSLEQRPT